LKLWSKALMLDASLFVVGGAVYQVIELVWRGYTHWSMFIAAGICVLIIKHTSGFINGILYQSILGGLIITAVEFMAGCIFNLLLGMNVWNYSSVSFNVMGQICPLYTCFWMLLSCPVLFLCRFGQWTANAIEQRRKAV